MQDDFKQRKFLKKYGNKKGKCNGIVHFYSYYCPGIFNYIIVSITQENKEEFLESFSFFVSSFKFILYCCCFKSFICFICNECDWQNINSVFDYLVYHTYFTMETRHRSFFPKSHETITSHFFFKFRTALCIINRLLGRRLFLFSCVTKQNT